MNNTEPNPEIAAEKARAALSALEAAWAYFTPEPWPFRPEPDPAEDLFQSYAAA